MTDASLWLQAGHAWWVLHCDPETKSLERPFVVRFDHCTDVAVHDAGWLGGDHVRVEVAAQPTHVIRQLGFARRLLDFGVDRVV